MHRHRLDHIGIGDLGREIAEFTIDTRYDNGLIAAHQIEGSCGHRILLVQWQRPRLSVSSTEISRRTAAAARRRSSDMNPVGDTGFEPVTPRV